MVDITKPLERGRFLTIGDTKYWIPLKYEKLPNFCYHYDMIKHPSSRCEKLSREKLPAVDLISNMVFG